MPSLEAKTNELNAERRRNTGINAEKRENTQHANETNRKPKKQAKTQKNKIFKKGSSDKPLNVSTAFKQQVCLFIEVRSAQGMEENASKSSPTPVVGLPSLDASGLAEFIRFDCCPRFFKLKIDRAKEKSRRWHEAFKPISPLLYGVGKKLEEKKVSELKENVAQYFDFSSYKPRESITNLRKIIDAQISAGEQTDSRPVLLYQVPMRGHIGVWDVNGIADLIAIWPLKDGKVKIRVFELKSSWKEQTAHRIQVAIYVLLLSQELVDLSSKFELEGGVINRETNLQSLTAENLPKFKLSPLIQDVERLLAENGELNRIHRTPLEKVEYQLCWRCDNCGFNECCIVCAVENESIALLNLSRGEQNALRHHGIEQLEDLAKLKVVSDASDLRPYDFKTIPAKDTEKVHALSTDPVVGAKLDWLVERAQYMLGGIRPKQSICKQKPLDAMVNRNWVR